MIAEILEESLDEWKIEFKKMGFDTKDNNENRKMGKLA